MGGWAETNDLPESTAGIPWIWIGVGFRMPFARRHSRMGSGYLMSLNDLIGGGTSSPSTRMCHCKKTCVGDIYIGPNWECDIWGGEAGSYGDETIWGRRISDLVTDSLTLLLAQRTRLR